MQKVDLLIFVADPSRRGLDTIVRLYQLAKDMEIKYNRLAIIVNRQNRTELSDDALRLKVLTKSDCIFGLPEDDEIRNISEKGESIFELSEKNEIIQALDGFIKDQFKISQ